MIDKININSTIPGSIIDIINMDSTIAGSMINTKKCTVQ